MIPYSLTLTNFLSYRDTAELDLRGVHLACISGLNGAGKSSILDAITWALFGKSRSGDDDVINRIAAGNGKAAEVSFIFELEGALYRIMRRKAIGKTTELEFHVHNDDSSSGPPWRTLTESKMRETERAIRDLLRMDYDIFTNASFLLQGKADEFTTKTPNRRKEILAEILGVSVWDDHKSRATDARKVVDTELALVGRQAAEIDVELAEEDERRAALEQAEAREREVLGVLETQSQLVALLRQNQAIIEQQRQLLARTTSELEAAQVELRRAEQTAAQRRANLEQYRTLLDRRAEVEAAFVAWEAVDAEFAGWQARAEAHSAIEKERFPLEMAIANVRTRLQQQQQELESREREAAAAAAERDALGPQLAADRAKAEVLEAQRAALAEQEAAYHEARVRLQELAADRKLREQEHAQLAAQATAVENARQERAMVEASRLAAETGLQQARARLAALVEQQQRVNDAKGEQEALRLELAHIQAEANKRKARVQQLEAEIGQDCPLCGQPLTTEHRANAIRELQGEVDELRARYASRQSRSREVSDEIAGFNELEQRQTQLERERATHESARHRYQARLENIDATLSTWDEGAGAARLVELGTLLAADAGLDALQGELEALKMAAEQIKQVTRQQQILLTAISKAEARCAELERLVSQWETAGRPELEATRRELSAEAFAREERAALAAVEARLVAVGYDAAAHATARIRRNELAGAPEEHQKLRQAEAAVAPLADGLEQLDQQSQRTAARVASLRADRDQLTARMVELQAGEGDLGAAERELDRLRLEQTAAIRAVGRARQRVEVLEDQRQARDLLREERQRLAGRLGMLKQLEEACGRNGVQALLIETALPEIEDHANDLLHRLSGGDMRVRFETQKAQKTTGNQVETLDIKISDSTGERPYENYSGGEKFRVNFAIRLALSQVLARRAGARLRTLVIDEGFGSQDPEGRQRLVEAINEVQSEFDCILVITHIDELRDKFPARIDVEKTPGGSRMAVVVV